MSVLKDYSPRNIPDHIALSQTVSGQRASTYARLKTAFVTLSSGNLLGMYATPVSVIAGITGHILVPDVIVFEMVRTATAYANGGTINLQYHTTTTSIPHSGTIPATVLTSAGAGTTLTLLGPNTGSNGTTIPAGEGIDITNGTGAFITGTGVAYLWITYFDFTVQ